MGKSLEPRINTTFECRSILYSIQNEFEKRQQEDSILSKLQEDLAELIAQRNILSKRKEFNEKYCILCCSTFNLLFKRKVRCEDCQFFVCRTCSVWCNSTKQWICKVCEKQKVLNAESRAWICSHIKTHFGTFGSAKILQNFCRVRKISDSENDSGYGANSDFIPLMKLLSSQSINKDLKMADCEEEDDDIGDEEELAEIHHSIETILEGLLGGTLDDASVDYLYPNSLLYLNLFISYHKKLIEVIQNLSKALQKALHNLPAENGITPTSAHAALKNVISTLVEECQELPFLQVFDQKDIEASLNSVPDFTDVFSSYDSLVAAAVINKVVEECQSRFKTDEFTAIENNLSVQQESADNEKLSNEFELVTQADEIYSDMATAATNAFDLPVECVKIEEIEEITQEFTDSEDDKLSSISKWSNSLQSVEEVGVSKHPEFDMMCGIDLMNDGPTPFPEFGCDLVDEIDSKSSDIICHPTAVTSWEENWLFRKKRRLPLYSNLRYQLLTYCDEPPSMLIPCPSESADTFELEESTSELSETHSAGSLEFSTDSDDVRYDVGEESKVADLAIKLQNETFSKSVQQISTQTVDPSPVVLPEKISLPQRKKLCQLNDIKTDQSSPKFQADELPYKLSVKESSDVPQQTVPLKCEERCKVPSKNAVQVNEELVASPPKPGTIAEREHKKWLNAVPLKNNPYSAENISKRSSKRSILKEPISSFEEFQRKLSVSSETSETSLNKVNCGPKSIDSELYKRDYYINKEYDPDGINVYALQRSPRHLYSVQDDCFDVLSEEALNSFEEKVYISSGKVFTLENHVKRLEREIKDTCPSLELSNSRGEQVTYKKVDVASNKVENEKIKKSRPCMKVHSLTARSLSREFRDLAKMNLPKPMNRTVQVPSQAYEEGVSERDSLCSPESAQDSFNASQPDNAHGYTSDESNASSSSVPRAKARRHISRSILQRATYWERRAEQGLLSDASVNEEFPGVDINPD
ncbi:uncharacterized protein LOC129224286 [Uloborus diversus]|uniref:uncharacterized protein LOC129224286 n=1 Tax=Uloborus diversus TaxID=327109 RepID=UPI00240970F8|nr:uncharacterized protein LOC129224286 [Uloborus diversus]